jgi:MFS family permease
MGQFWRERLLRNRFIVTIFDVHFPRPKPPRFFYGYIVVITAFIIMVLSWGLYIVFGVFFTPLLAEFGWTRAVTSGAYSLSSILHGVLGIAMGGLTDRFGPRIVVTFCGFFLGLGYLLMSQVNSVWQLYLFYGVIIGIGMSGLWVPLLTTVARWFVGKRSMMTGIVISGLTIGQLIAPPIITRLIAAYDWRLSYIIIGGVVLIIVMSAAQFLKRDPGPLVRLPDDDGKQENSGSSSNDYSIGEAVSTWQFWMFWFGLFCLGFAAFSVTVHIVPHAIDLGVSDVAAANVLAINGGIGIIGNFVLGGIIGDRIGNRKVFFIGFLFMAAALVWLVLADELWVLYLFAVIFGIAMGGAGTSESPLIARLFGLNSHGLIYAFLGLGFTAGGAVGPVMTGYIFDVAESYQLAFWICAAFSFVGFILMVLLRPTKKLGISL